VTTIVLHLQRLTKDDISVEEKQRCVEPLVRYIETSPSLHLASLIGIGDTEALFWKAVAANSCIDQLSFRGRLPYAAFHQLMSTTVSLTQLDLDHTELASTTQAHQLLVAEIPSRKPNRPDFVCKVSSHVQLYCCRPGRFGWRVNRPRSGISLQYLGRRNCSRDPMECTLSLLAPNRYTVFFNIELFRISVRVNDGARQWIDVPSRRRLLRVLCRQTGFSRLPI
jgi:hypothetical protein